MITTVRAGVRADKDRFIALVEDGISKCSDEQLDIIDVLAKQMLKVYDESGV